MRAAGKPLWSITCPDGIESLVVADDPLAALALFHAEALGHANVHLADGKVVFAHAEDQLCCVGTWLITRRGGGRSPQTVAIEIPPPD
jgi:hypothetical protein